MSVAILSRAVQLGTKAAPLLVKAAPALKIARTSLVVGVLLDTAAGATSQTVRFVLSKDKKFTSERVVNEPPSPRPTCSPRC